MNFANSSIQLQQAPFGLMIPGYLSLSQFQVIGNYFTLDLVNPQTTHSIAFYLQTPLDQGVAACLYYSRYPYDGITFIGAIANERPSDIFTTSFNQILNPEDQVKLVMAIEPINEKIVELVKLTNESQNKLQYALTIAYNLYNFITAYNQEIIINGDRMDVLVTPPNILNLWLMKFQQKYKENPNFIYKTTTK